MTDTVPALILGAHVTGLGVLRALGRAGIPALCAAAGSGDFAHSSRWYRPAPALRSGESLVDYLSRIPVERAVLIPCSDYLTLEAARLGPELAGRFPTSVATAAILGAVLNKGRFAEVLTAAGLPHPETVIVRRAADLAGVPERLWVSAFLKPRDSQAFFARYGVKALQVRSRADAVGQLERLAAEGFEMLVQEYIPGPASNHYFVDGFVDRTGRTCGTFVRRRLRMYPPDFGNSTHMISIVPAEAAGAVETVHRLVECLKYRGTFSAEFKYDARDRTFKILEVNARPWWYVEFAQQCGVNVPLMIYRDALGQSAPVVDRYRVGRSLVYPYYDFYACVAARRAGQLSLVQWLGSWATSLQPVFSWDDPLPALRWIAAWLGRRWRLGRRDG